MMMKTKTSRKKKRKLRRYSIELNRMLHNSSRWVAGQLERLGIKVQRMSHLTALLLELPPDMTWDEFKNVLRSVIQPGRGSVLVQSCVTGNVFVCDNRGNRPGRFVLQEMD